MKARLIKPVKHDLSSRSSVFTPVSPISKTEILSGKYPVKFYRILPDSRIFILHPVHPYVILTFLLLSLQVIYHSFLNLRIAQEGQRTGKLDGLSYIVTNTSLI